jgi:hypothetical protein
VDGKKYNQNIVYLIVILKAVQAAAAAVLNVDAAVLNVDVEEHNIAAVVATLTTKMCKK